MSVELLSQCKSKTMRKKRNLELAPAKPVRDNVKLAHIGLADGENHPGQIIQAGLAGLWRRKWLILVTTAAALAFGLLGLRLMPARYAAEAYIRGEFAASDTVAKDADSVSTGSLSLDVVRVIETQSLLLQSHQVARRVVQDLGLERLRPVVGSGGWLPAIFNGGSAKTSGDELDVAAGRLLRGLGVTSDPRAYLITVRYSAGDPELAALIANTFVAELLRSTKLQQLLQQRSLAESALSKQLGKFGEKHPAVVEARLRIAAMEAQLKGELAEAREAILQEAGENVAPAIAAPSGPRLPFVIGLALLLGLAVGTGVALWLERNRWWRAFSLYYAHGPLTLSASS